MIGDGIGVSQFVSLGVVLIFFQCMLFFFFFSLSSCSLCGGFFGAWVRGGGVGDDIMSWPFDLKEREGKGEGSGGW